MLENGGNRVNRKDHGQTFNSCKMLDKIVCPLHWHGQRDMQPWQFTHSGDKLGMSHNSVYFFSWSLSGVHFESSPYHHFWQAAKVVEWSFIRANNLQQLLHLTVLKGGFLFAICFMFQVFKIKIIHPFYNYVLNQVYKLSWKN